MMVNFNTQFQFRLIVSDLPKLYNRYGDDFKTPCLRFAVDKMNDIAAKYRAS